MRSLVKLAVTATLAIGAAAAHNHRHHHLAKKRGSGVLRRNAAVKTVTEQAVATEYVIDGQPIPDDEARAGIKNGDYIVVDESFAAPPLPPPPPPASLPAAQSTQPVAPTTVPSPEPLPSVSPVSGGPVAVVPDVGPGSDYDIGDGGHDGIDAEFPDDQLPCDFASVEKYGAVALDWLDIGGWAGVQKTPNYREGDVSIDYIVTAEKGDGCDPGSFCSYACPMGYQKLQWPEAQGSTLQSIGGLYCTPGGRLRLTRPEKKTLCGKGAGGVTIRNDLDQDVVTCRTDYPGTECMVIPIVSPPGSERPVTNPASADYYHWNGAATTAQYYVNKKGYGVEDTCVWNSPLDPSGAGNFSPMNIGVGQNEEGITYLSIFLNKPSSTAVLNFNIEIKGDVSIECSYVGGVFSNPALEGCTTAVKPGGQAQIRYF